MTMFIDEGDDGVGDKQPPSEDDQMPAATSRRRKPKKKPRLRLIESPTLYDAVEKDEFATDLKAKRLGPRDGFWYGEIDFEE
ncbi:MAG: hypothetical protein C0519_04165 [Hyphomicrobium sp.]|nr:hypothetical protein [Hyphomicrobium sp.]PPD07721.1 MAG: hypothetical protein CTY28_07685 [Hyphomicrobium sp.]